MNSMTFQKEGDYVVCYINGKEVSRSKLANTGSSEEEIIDVINDQIKANPTLAGTEDRLNGLQVGDNKYANPEGQTITANPTLVGTEPNLEGLELGNSKYKVSKVEANPTLAGTESDLSSIGIDGTNYVIPQGGGTSLMSDIEDADGNKRFVEGAGTTNTISDVTFSYCKWSLSGTHIMFVCAGTMVNNVTAQTFCTFTIPQWIHDKIVGIGRYGEIELKETTAYGINSSSSAPVNFMLQKLTNNPDITIKLNDAFSRSSTLGFRVQFDLLIDTE